MTGQVDGISFFACTGKIEIVLRNIEISTVE
jgi:hypothetical protein